MHPSGEISPDLSERLISGDATQPARLVALLAAASAPGTRRELAGEDAAVMAFRQARSAAAAAPTTGPVRRPAPPRAWTGRFGVRVALLTAAAVVSGLGLATMAGVIPDVTGLVPTGNSSSTLDTSGAGQGHPTTTGVTTAGTELPPSASAGATGGPSAAALPGLCRAYRAHAANERGKQLDTPAFAALVTAAGGREAVPAYCDALIGPEDTSTTTPKPTGTHGRSGSVA
jgi:hypothetical protein